MKVWERGVGITRACGSGACAAVAASIRRGKTDYEVDVKLDGGNLKVKWLDLIRKKNDCYGGKIILSGSYANVANGLLHKSLIA